MEVTNVITSKRSEIVISSTTEVFLHAKNVRRINPLIESSMLTYHKDARGNIIIDFCARSIGWKKEALQKIIAKAQKGKNPLDFCDPGTLARFQGRLTILSGHRRFMLLKILAFLGLFVEARFSVLDQNPYCKESEEILEISNQSERQDIFEACLYCLDNEGKLVVKELLDGLKIATQLETSQVQKIRELAPLLSKVELDFDPITLERIINDLQVEKSLLWLKNIDKYFPDTSEKKGKYCLYNNQGKEVNTLGGEKLVPGRKPKVTPEVTPPVTPEVTPEVTPPVTPEVTPKLSIQFASRVLTKQVKTLKEDVDPFDFLESYILVSDGDFSLAFAYWVKALEGISDPGQRAITLTWIKRVSSLISLLLNSAKKDQQDRFFKALAKFSQDCQIYIPEQINKAFLKD